MCANCYSRSLAGLETQDCGLHAGSQDPLALLLIRYSAGAGQLPRMIICFSAVQLLSPHSNLGALPTISPAVTVPASSQATNDYCVRAGEATVVTESIPVAATFSPGAAEIQRLARKGLFDSMRLLDEKLNGPSGWGDSGKDNGVDVAQRSVKGANVCMYRGLFHVSADAAPDFEDLIAVMLSHSSRAIYDDAYCRSRLLVDSGEGTGLVCFVNKTRLLTLPSYFVSNFAVQRVRGAACRGPGVLQSSEDCQVEERVTLSITRPPLAVIAPYEQTIQESAGDAIMGGPIVWTVDLLRHSSGGVRLGFLFHADGNASRLPGFLSNRIFGTAIAQPILQLLRLANMRMTPRGALTLTGPDRDDTELRGADGCQLQVSALFRGIFPASGFSGAASG